MRRTIHAFSLVCTVASPFFSACATPEEADAWAAFEPVGASQERALFQEPAPLPARGRFRLQPGAGTIGPRSTVTPAGDSIESLEEKVAVCDPHRCGREYDQCILAGRGDRTCRADMVRCLDCHDDE